jgi:hypothetical protein
VRRRPHGAPQSPFYILPRAAGKKKERKRKNFGFLEKKSCLLSSAKELLIGKYDKIHSLLQKIQR